MRIFITGVSSGLGFSIAQMLAQKGHYVIGTVLNKKELKTVSKNIPENFFPLIMDITKEYQINNGFNVLKSKHDNFKLDVIINNAGIGSISPALEEDINFIKHLYDVNLFGVIRVLQAAANFLNSGAKIINIGSLSSELTIPFIGIYASSKAALTSLSQTLSLEEKKFSVSCISPGIVNTSIWKFFLNKSFHKESKHAKRIDRLIDLINRLRKTSSLTGEDIGNVVEKILSAPKPKIIYEIPNSLFIWILLKKMPNYLRTKVMNWYFRA